ncbi:MAG: M13 family metallopeptidase [Bacteroidota bacterium]|nr:M13 family metallopeptidase [Bacteroidota bacterium]MDP4212023.1 M13 family metallopeptidase [Bacteroidota bacterium]MDP4249959.1 M13 family metallopeptidase [Bacteroidota bacterium]
MKWSLSFLISVSVLFFSCQHPAGSGKATGGTDPLDLSSHDTSVRPQSNFFLYANGAWLKRTVIPPSQSSWGSFSTLRDSISARLYRILDSISRSTSSVKGSIAQQAGDLFYSAMDSAGIERRGLMPVRPELDSIGNIKNTADLMNEIAAEYKVNHGPFISFYVSADDKNSTLNAAHFDQGGLGLPNRDFYFKKDSASVKIRKGYTDYIRQIFTLTGDHPAEADKKAMAIMELETALAKISKGPVALRDPLANYNKESVASLNKTMPGFKNFLKNLGVNADTVLMGQPAFYRGLYALIRKTPLQTLKTYLCFHVLNDDADYLPHDFVNAKFEFNKLLNGQTQMRERWKRMGSMVDQQLGDAIGQLYVQQYFPPEAKQRINEMVDNILTTYGERIRQLDWMSDSTKQKALVKLQAIVKKVGYPDKWKDYSSVTIARDNIISNLKATTHYAYLRDIHKIGKPVDRSEWYMTPPTVNAYYNPTANDVNFPAGILQPPFYFISGDDAVNYGAIGIGIGHEITHGFDDQGRQFDADGNLKEWWTAEDARKFKARAQKIIDQYNGYIAVDTLHVNGDLTQGENIADNGGTAIAYAAFKKTAQGKGDEKIDGLTPDQRFFLAGAQIWRTKNRPEYQRTLALSDPHSPPMWRINGMFSNMPAFYKAFHVEPTDSMYRPDSLRVKIW